MTETPSGSCEKTGGGEWTALREALQRIANLTCGCHDSADENWHGERCPKGIAGEALAAAAPAPPDAQGCPLTKPNLLTNATDFNEHLQHTQKFLLEMYQVMVDPIDEFDGNIEDLCALLLKRAREDREKLAAPPSEDASWRWLRLRGYLRQWLTPHHFDIAMECLDSAAVAPPPQDGQGAELLGPPSKAEREVATATDGLSVATVPGDNANLTRIARELAGEICGCRCHKGGAITCVCGGGWECPARHEPLIRAALELWGAACVNDVRAAASAPVGEKVRDTESFTRGRHWELAEYENHLRSHNPQIGGVCSWCKLETQWGRVVQPQPSGVGEPREVGDEVWVRGKVVFVYRDGCLQVKFERADPMNNQIAFVEPETVCAAREVGEGLREALLAKAKEWRERVAGSKLRFLTDYETGRYNRLSDCADEIEALAAPASAPPAQPSCKCSALDEHAICNACADMLRQQVQRQREINAELVKPAPPAEPTK